MYTFVFVNLRNNEALCGPALHYSVDLRIQTHIRKRFRQNMENSTQNICGYTDIFTVHTERRGLAVTTNVGRAMQTVRRTGDQQ